MNLSFELFWLQQNLQKGGYINCTSTNSPKKLLKLKSIGIKG